MNAELLADLEELDSEDSGQPTEQLREQFEVAPSSASVLLRDPHFLEHLRVVDELISRKLEQQSLQLSE